jgi:mRNA interferase RelE/StbE
VDSCGDPSIRKKVGIIFGKIELAENMSGVANLKKLRGAKNSYRIRVGDYRIGLTIEGDLLVFAAFDHRSDIYKYFP